MTQKKTKNSPIESTQKSLSIQFSLGGFSFCIIDITSGKPIVFTEYLFDAQNPEELLPFIENIFSTDIDLQQDFKNVSVIHQNNLASLVPNAYFDENKLKTYLDFNVKTLANDYITFDELTKLDAKNVYIPYVNINNYLFQNFGSFEFKHHSSVLIEKLLSYAKNSLEKQFFVYVGKHSLDIIVSNNSTLLLYNSFPFYTKEDFIYYILFVAEQLQLNTDELTITFLGDIEESSELYNITHNYIRTIRFIESESDFFNDSEEFSNHSNYILIS